MTSGALSFLWSDLSTFFRVATGQEMVKGKFFTSGQGKVMENRPFEEKLGESEII